MFTLSRLHGTVRFCSMSLRSSRRSLIWSSSYPLLHEQIFRPDGFYVDRTSLSLEKDLQGWSSLASESSVTVLCRS